MVLKTMTQSYKLFVRSVGLVGLSNSFASIKGIILLPIYTRIIGVSNYGILSIISVTFFILEP